GEGNLGGVLMNIKEWVGSREKRDGEGEGGAVGEGGVWYLVGIVGGVGKKWKGGMERKVGLGMVK
ncbi:hypothetical protein, partial [Neisseria sicca]|uniref:hypothetical protein n=1 Tax=Neisseria sicca TaxID=490 RepID=UPI001C9A2B7C